MLKRIRQDFRRSVWLLAALVAIAVLMRWVISRGKPERLFDLPPSGEARLIGIRGGEAYFLSGIQAPVASLRARSLAKKTDRIVAEDPGLSIGTAMLMTDDALYYKVLPEGVPGPATPRITGASQSRMPGVSGPVMTGDVKPMPMASGPQFAPPMPGAQPEGNGGESRRGGSRSSIPVPLEGVGDPPGGPVWNGDAPPAKVRRIALAGGGATDVAVPLARRPGTHRDYAVLGDQVYFTRFAPSPPPPHTAPLAKRKACSVELLACSLAGGPERRIGRVPGILSMLYAGRTRLFWIVSRPDEPGTVDLYHLGRDEETLQVVRDYRSWAPPAAAGDRLFWITRRYVRHSPRMAALTLETSSLVSARFDGSDHREIDKIIHGGQEVHDVSRPLVEKDRVYVHVTERDQDHPGMSRSEALCRVRSDLSGLETVAGLPKNSGGGGFVEGGWYYFAVSDRRQGWLDYLSDGINLQYVDVLHRVKLPE